MSNSESQNVEWKESWRDEYIKWICGFANAQGGVLHIGRNNQGEVVGLENSGRLLEDIPNKVRDVLGILVDVNARTEGELEYLEIVVEPYPYPVSYKGQYHYRSGSTKQELRGAALDRFLLQKQGKRWDGVPVPNVSVDDLKPQTFGLFRRRAFLSRRIDEEALQDSNASLLESLHLTEGEYLKRAAILLFHPAPERFITGAYVKIGYFESDDDLRYQDEIHGNLFEQILKALDLLKTKYLKANIRYEGADRVEELIFPEAAIREALLNAIAHKDYSGGVPIQISVYQNRVLFWNEGLLPDSWTVENLVRKHPSKPFNPDIANTLFRAGYIEAWGRGTIKMITECQKYHLPIPRYYFDASGFVVEFFRYTEADMRDKGMKEELIKIILYVQEKGRINNSLVQQLCNVSKPTATRYLSELEREKYLHKTGTTGAGTEYSL